MSLTDEVREFVALCENGQTLRAIETYYAEDVVVFENYERARTGRDACISYERDALSRMKEPSTLRAKAQAIDPVHGIVFLEWEIRFVGDDERPMRLDEVSVQHWLSGRIVEERFYYAGVIDEGDEDPVPAP